MLQWDDTRNEINLLQRADRVKAGGTHKNGVVGSQVEGGQSGRRSSKAVLAPVPHEQVDRSEKC